MTETQERFLRTILTRVPSDDIVELHLFPPIRRGTMETGVAVIATLLPPVPLTVIDTETPVVDEVNGAGDAAVPESFVATADTGAEAMAAAETAPVEAASHDDAVDDDAVEGDADEDDSPYADEPVATVSGDVVNEASDESADMQLVPDDTGADVAADVPAAPAPRLRILTAMYRHTVKGIDRGKWVVDVQEEADAPLAAVEAVLRGVRQRSTEPADPELVSPDMLAALLEPTRVAPAA